MKTIHGYRSFIEDKKKEIKDASKESYELIQDMIEKIKEIVDMYSDYVEYRSVDLVDDSLNVVFPSDFKFDYLNIYKIDINLFTGDSYNPPKDLQQNIAKRVISEFGDDVWESNIYFSNYSKDRTTYNIHIKFGIK